MPSVEEAAFKWFDMFNRGRITVEVDTADLGKRIGAVAAIGRQATVGLIVVGQLIGTAIVMAILLEPSASGFEGFAYAAMIAFAITLLVSFWVLFRTLDRPRRRRAPATPTPLATRGDLRLWHHRQRCAARA